MRREDARSLARALMDAHGLQEWTFRFDRARRRAGACTHATRTISLSAPLVDLYDEEAVRGVILHEVAHALVGDSHHHDEVWRRCARRIGAPDSARLPASLPSPRAPWVGTCPRCGASRELFSAPRRVVACGACSRVFDPTLVLVWTRDGVPTTPGGSYARELRRLHGTHRRAG
ncbi:SprT-like domain-containing protein [Actinomyces polynesiensis]|uniref:SprT-like domain-containing protein n=1 Tax=Actinomyces polynesiensis TaxID=1325934 RepID=UPI0005BBA6FF|nr:SprT-like domain-containing protein [Actinomyces polynesiensis]